MILLPYGSAMTWLYGSYMGCAYFHGTPFAAALSISARGAVRQDWSLYLAS